MSNDKEEIIREFCLHKHGRVLVVSDTWAGHFITDLV